MTRSPEVEPFLRGCAWPAGPGVPYPRCDPGPQGLRLPADTRAAASLPVGVRLEFTGECDAIEIEYRTETRELGYRGAGAGTRFALFRGAKRIADAETALGEGVARLPAGAGPEPAIVYLPEGMRPTLHALHAQGGAIEPAPRGPRWLCYGDSIAEGWCASEPAGAWPHRVAREHGLDVVNLGYAGAARGEIASAEELAVLPAELISISHGTNCWTRTPQSAALFAANLSDFLAIVRAGHPRTPIVCVSPILRPDAEAKRNRLSASLADLRAAFERVACERRSAGDTALWWVSGLPLVRAEQLPDGIHPDDTGHAEIARALGPGLADVARGGEFHA
ncbi:MAG TPA: GDSL-type esterase/lipase family protein [Myxococcota bacterium]|nr:GDSL-type esterase/lipase family protein [Myxococcota bacterium]